MEIVDINGKIRQCHNVFLDKNWPGYVTVEFESKNDPGTMRKEWYPLADFATNNPGLKEKFKKGSTKRAEETSGIVSKSGSNWLSDQQAKWGKNIYAGYHLWISRGPGDGQTRIILKNTDTKLFIDKPWDKKPNHDSQYAIVRQIGSVKPTGNVLPITELRILEEKARQMDIDRGIKPSPRQYTIDTHQRTKVN
jgi:hypothetical protein